MTELDDNLSMKLIKASLNNDLTEELYLETLEYDNFENSEVIRIVQGGNSERLDWVADEVKVYIFSLFN